ncbi:tail fiber domain-containing protein [Vibrio parahaemolyticus]|nr:tail fiber domain-containing protein [Vibrio parahaemolyticus]
MPSFVSVKSPNFGSVAQINKEEITNVYKLDNADIQSYYNEQSREYRDKAHQWAEESENVEVQPNEYSAKHYSLKSRQAANDASFAQTKAEQAQAQSESAEEAAALSEVNASTSEANAKSSETSAAESASAASLSESNSKVSELAAKDSENSSATSEANAKASESAAATSETNAKASELASKNSESASRTSELNASQSATAAATSETNAKTSELAAKSSATNADTSASEARADAIRAEIAADAAASALSPKGDWDASTGLFPSPTMSPERADFYQISVAGTMSNSNAAQPDISVEVGDQLYWNLEKDIWYKIDNTDLVRTVDGMQGDVVIDKYTKAEVNAIESGLQNQIDTITPTSIGALPVNGTANKADKWTNARKITLNGDASGMVSIDGSSDVTLNVTVANDSHTHDDRYYTENEVDAIESVLQSQIDARPTYSEVGLTSGQGKWRAVGRASGDYTPNLDDVAEYPGFHTTLVSTSRLDTSLSQEEKDAIVASYPQLGNTWYSGIWYLENMNLGNTTSSITQVLHPYRVQDGKWFRTRFNGVWKDWVRVYDEYHKPTALEVGAYTTEQVDAIESELQSQIGVRTTYDQVGLLEGNTDYKAVGLINGISGPIDWDTLTEAGVYATLAGTGSTNGPSTNSPYYYAHVYKYDSVAENLTQIAIPYGVASNQSHMAYRTRFNGVWHPWAILYSTDQPPTPNEIGAYTTTQVDTIESGLQDQIDTLDGGVVKTTGDQSVAGVKNFSNDVLATSIRSALGVDQGLLLFSGGSTRLGGTGSAAGIQLRPNGRDVASDTDYFSFQPNGTVEYEGASNFSISRAGGQHGVFAYADGRTFLTGDDNDVEIRPRGLSDSTRRLIVKENGSVVQEHSGGAAYTFQDAVNTGTGSSSYFSWTHDDGVRRGFIGYGSSANNNMTWFNDEGNNSMVMLDTGEIRFTPGTVGYVNNTKNTAFNSKVVYGGTSDAWLRLNPYNDFSNGIYGGNSLIRTDADITSNDWGTASQKAARITGGFTDSVWGANSTTRAAFSLNQPDTVSAHWMLASYYDTDNIRSGIQVLSGTDGRMRLWTDGATKYAEIYNGGIRVTGAQLGDTNSLTRKDYVDGVASDKRLKSNIKTVEDALSIVNKISVNTYLKEVKEWDEESQKDKVTHKFEYGFIAQEVEEVLPHLVTEREQDGMKEILRTGNDLHALSFGSIQQLKAENQELKERLAAIEAKLEL